MAKRLFDIFFSFLGLLLIGPIMLVFAFLVWRQDKHSPFYMANRAGRNGREFRMVKLRTMVVNADKSGVNSTSSDDKRITPLGKRIRKYKVDELYQLWNVLKGDMSLVGPRPNLKCETDLYTSEEQLLLTVRPGITDFSSIVFSDEGEILFGADDPDLKYNQYIRPWKSRLGIFYVMHRNLLLDTYLILITILATVNKAAALRFLNSLLVRSGADPVLIDVAKRESELYAYPPPGSDQIIGTSNAFEPPDGCTA